MAFKEEKADDSITMHNSKFAQTMKLANIWLKNASHLAVTCSIMPTGIQHRHKQDASHYWGSKLSSILKKKSPVERNMVRWTEDLTKLHNCYRQTWVQQFWIQNLKMPILICCKSVLICWKFECKQSLKPNDLKRIQLYSSHSVSCP